MEYPRIALKVSSKAFNKLIDLGNRVHAGLQGNLAYTSPQPALTILRDNIDSTVAALALAGEKGNRGSKADYIDLCNKALALQLTLKQLAAYCTTTAGIAAGNSYPDLQDLLSTSGFTLAVTKAERTRLEAVRAFRQVVSAAIAKNQVKLTWTRPVNTVRSTDVTNYVIYKGVGAEFSTAAVYAIVQKGEFIDTNESGAMQTWYLWVVGYNHLGAGVPSGPVVVTVLPI